MNRKLRITMVSVLIILSGLIMIMVIYLALISTGRPEACKDENGNIPDGSISEKIFVPIGGTMQGMFIKSKNLDNPVLLYVHGGPCFPNYFLFEKFNPGLEDFFTVCYWEQRGGGLSYTPRMKAESINLERLASDAIELTHYLCHRFGMEKIYIMAHSGGTAIALPAVSKAPELYHAYIAMAQVSKQADSEKIAYKYLLARFTENNDKRSLKKMRKFNELQSDSDILLFFNSVIRDKAMHKLGIGTMRSMRSVILDIFMPVWTCRAYTLGEKIRIWRSKFWFLPQTSLQKEILSTDFPATISRIDIPVYFISGKFDLTVNIDLSRAYFDKLKAPLKGFYTFENSAHSPLFEESEMMKQILRTDVLEGKTSLAIAYKELSKPE